MRFFDYAYICDHCEEAELSFREYFFNRSSKKRYCNRCFPLIYLLEGKCNSCKNEYSNTYHKKSMKKQCICGQQVYLTQTSN